MQQLDLDMISHTKIMAIVLTEERVKANQIHKHSFAQLYCLQQGQMIIRSDKGIIVTPPQSIGWIPPYCEHNILANKKITGWTVLIDESCVAFFPQNPSLLSCSFLIEPLIRRLAEWDIQKMKTQEFRNLVDVFFDELKQAIPKYISLPIPQDPRLKKIALHLIENTQDDETFVALAQRVGLSSRSLSRYWANEVGMSIKKYRQMAKIFRSLDYIALGESIEQCAWKSGFSSASAYILAFKAVFKNTPKEYQKMIIAHSNILK